MTPYSNSLVGFNLPRLASYMNQEDRSKLDALVEKGASIDEIGAHITTALAVPGTEPGIAAVDATEAAS